MPLRPTCDTPWDRERIDVGWIVEGLREKARRFPLPGERTIVTALWLRQRPEGRLPVAVVTARDVMRVLR